MTADNRVLEAALGHGYLFPYRGKGSDLGPRNNLQAATLASMQQSGMIDQVVVIGGHWWGRKYPTFATVFSDELARRGVENIVPIHEGGSSSEEIDIFLAESIQQGWKTTGNLVTRDHAPRVSLLSGRRQPHTMQPLIAEEILGKAVSNGILEEQAREEAAGLLAHFANPANTERFRNKEEKLIRLTEHGFERILVKVGHSTTVNRLKARIDS